MTELEKNRGAARLLEQLRHSQSFHHDGTTGVEREFGILRRWQAARLAHTHADLRAHPDYRPAAEFFLDELYGDRDFRQLEHDLARIVPTMTRILPAKVLYAAALALELNALSYELDARMARILAVEFGLRDALDEATYLAAYRRCASYEQRRRQIDLVEQLGRDLRRVVHKPLIQAALKLAKTPARLAGLGELHRFLEAGFRAFRHMGAEAETFITLIARREREIMERIRAAHPQPLDLGDGIQG